MFLIGTVFVTRQGVHWLELFDTFVANVALFLVGGLECARMVKVAVLVGHSRPPRARQPAS
tara:strand:- start:185 stop:367 length:183 start_codon:yes stop_codon:yes gene_type:complete